MNKETLNKIIEKATENGYRYFNNPIFEHCNSYLQKKFTDKKGIKYFIGICIYDDDFEITLQFNNKKPLDTINIRLFGFNNDITLNDIEEQVEHLWTKEYYELYEKDGLDE